MEGGISGRQTRSGRIIRPSNKAIHDAMLDAAETERKRAAAARKSAGVAEAKKQNETKAKKQKETNAKTKATKAGTGAKHKKRKTAEETHAETEATKAWTGAEHKKEVKRRNWKHEAATKRLKSFVFGQQPGGIQMLCRVVADPTCILETLSLGARDVTDRFLAPLLDALQFNQSVKQLGLVGSLGERVTRTTWHGIAKILRCQFSGLVTLNICNSIGLGDNEEDNEILLELRDALYGNKKLTSLLLFDYHLRFEGSWEPFSRLLCNKSSIAETFSSNHTLQKVVMGGVQPMVLREHLEMNQGAPVSGLRPDYYCSPREKFDIARRKIIKVHFTGEATEWTRHFDDMGRGVLPRAIAWMARGDCTMFFYETFSYPMLGTDRTDQCASHFFVQLAEELSFFYKFECC